MIAKVVNSSNQMVAVSLVLLDNTGHKDSIIFVSCVQLVKQPWHKEANVTLTVTEVCTCGIIISSYIKLYIYIMLLDIIQFISQIRFGNWYTFYQILYMYMPLTCNSFKLLLIKLLASILSILLINFTCSFVLLHMHWYIDKNLEKIMSCKYRRE